MLSIHRGGVNFNYLPRGVGIWKFLKSGWKYGAGGRCFQKGGGLALSPIPFFQGLSVLDLDILLYPIANLCYAFEEKLFFSATIILCNKAILR